ncbi:MAG: aromatic amino acid aminotransferase [Chloroflexi bacterium CG15_BIG_FIL_POST_REV_8_21_14_020_46_15]|nr:MAG: aromatic amino acid aminotransferase [Chloroflexi bacterium CG15_BIG_FIL_POST_REV_8_21_14_020_46_15]
MDNFISQKVNNISPSGIRKFFDLLSSLEGVISLGVGEPDFVTPWHIREAATYSLERGYTMYTSNYGMLELRQELAGYLERHYGVSYQHEREILVTVGVSEGLDLALRAIMNPGDEVIIPEPWYVSYPPCVILAGGIPVFVPTSKQNNFVLKAEDVEPLINKHTKAILIGYPSNPTGAVMSREELSKIARLAQKYNLLVISDEIYARLVYGVEHTCFASLPGMREQTILLGGFSKAFAMTGWRIGYLAANQQLIEAMLKIHQYTMLCVPTMSQMAAIEALRSGEDDVDKMVKEYDRRRKFIVKRLNEIGLPCFEPKGAFYAFPSIEATGMNSEEFAERLLMEERVAVVPGSAFGQCGEGFVRCCYATSLANIEEALKRMGRFVKKNR